MTIAAQLDYIADELNMTTRILESRENYRRLSEAAAKSRSKFGTAADVMAMEALYKLTRLEREYRDNFAPFEVIAADPDVEPLPDCGETKDEHPECYTRRRLMTADERADDPRRGQATR